MEPMQSSLSLAGILASLPHDAASIFTLTLLVAAIAGVIWVGRSRT